MFPVEGSVEPIPGHEGETRRRMWVFYASVVVSIAITTLTTHLMYKKHFDHFYAPSLQRLALRIASMPIIYSALLAFSSTFPHLFWLAELGIETYETFVIYNFFAFIVLWCGGIEGCIAEIQSYMQNLELDILLHRSKDGGGKDELWYLDIDEFHEDGMSMEVDLPSFERDIDNNNIWDGEEKNENDKTRAHFYGSLSSDKEVAGSGEKVGWSKLRGECGREQRGCLLDRLRCNTFQVRFDVCRLIFTSNPSNHFFRARVLVAQAMFIKPVILISSEFFLGGTESNKALYKMAKLASTVPLVAAMLSVIHIYRVLYPLLTTADATKKLLVIKGVVIFLALQQIVTTWMESTGQFSKIFNVELYSTQKISVRFYCWLVILEMALVAPLFACIFSPKIFKSLSDKTVVVKGLRFPFNGANLMGLSATNGGSCNSMEVLGKCALGKNALEGEGEKGEWREKIFFVWRVWEILGTPATILGGKGERYTRVGRPIDDSDEEDDGEVFDGEGQDSFKGTKGVEYAFTPTKSHFKVGGGNFDGVGRADSFANDGEVYEV